MDTIEMIQNAILNFCEDAKIIPCNNGGIQVNVEDPTNIPGILSTVADVMYDYSLDDVQITTNQARCEVYIDICDREEDDEEEEDPELEPDDRLYDDSEEVFDYTTGAKVEWKGKPFEIVRTEFIDNAWYMRLQNSETKEEVTVSLAEFNKIHPENI